jgi:Na+-translocating ferredoxin:NAD+ oxidoreductase RnfC subunit
VIYLEDQRFREIDNRFESIEKRQDRLEEKHEKHALEFAETKVYVKEIYKKMDAIAAALETMKAKSNTRMERFIEKLLWIALGIVGTYVATQLNLK